MDELKLSISLYWAHYIDIGWLGDQYAVLVEEVCDIGQGEHYSKYWMVRSPKLSFVGFGNIIQAIQHTKQISNILCCCTTYTNAGWQWRILIGSQQLGGYVCVACLKRLTNITYQYKYLLVLSYDTLCIWIWAKQNNCWNTIYHSRSAINYGSYIQWITSSPHFYWNLRLLFSLL